MPEATARFQLKAAEDYAATSPELRAKVDSGEITPKAARVMTERSAQPARPAEDAGDRKVRQIQKRTEAQALAAYMERVGAKKQQGKRTDKAKGGTSVTLTEVAKRLGVPRETAGKHLQAAEDYRAAAPQLKAKVDASADCT